MDQVPRSLGVCVKANNDHIELKSCSGGMESGWVTLVQQDHLQAGQVTSHLSQDLKDKQAFEGWRCRGVSEENGAILWNQIGKDG
jgi:hypothetical protein